MSGGSDAGGEATPAQPGSSGGGGGGGGPRKFVIQSTFGYPRERRSRKNRPCDACRRRKTACVITSEPPCLFCQSRGLVCQSSPTTSSGATPALRRRHHLAAAGTSPLADLAADGAGGSTTHQLPLQHHHRQHRQLRPQPPPQPAVVHQTLVRNSSSPLEDVQPSPPLLPSPPTADQAARSLEDIAGRTAYYMGPASEQDTFLLDAFRYGILGETLNVDANIVQVHAGSSLPDDRPMHFLLLEVGHPDHVNRARQAASDAIEAKVWPYGEHLVRLYFRHVHPVLPVASKVRFLRRYHADKKSVPACLRGALYALASPTMDDLRADEDVPEELRHLVEAPDACFDVSAGARFLEMVSIARYLRVVLDCSFQVNIRAMTFADRLQDQSELVTVQNKLRDWPSLLSSSLVIQHDERRRSSVTSYNCPLHLSFYAAQVLLYRALMYPPTRAAKKTPNSNLRRWFPIALAEFESFAKFLACINKHDLFGFWGRHARSQLILCGNFLVYLFLLAWERRDIERAYRLLESFHQTIHKLNKWDTVQVKTLLRTATIRIDSLFSQAVQIMRHGGDGTVTPMLNP